MIRRPSRLARAAAWLSRIWRRPKPHPRARPASDLWTRSGRWRPLTDEELRNLPSSPREPRRDLVPADWLDSRRRP